MELLEAFDINLKNLLFNLVNFAILYGVLYKFGYTPILNFVKDRTEKIEKGIQDAEAAKVALNEAKVRQEKVLADAHKEAQVIITKAKDAAIEQAEIVSAKKKEELNAVVKRAKEQLHAEQERIMRETQEQAVELVLVATEKLLMEKMDAEKDKAFIQKIVSEVQ